MRVLIGRRTGTRILFRTFPDVTDAPGGNIYTIRPDGTDLRQLTRFAPVRNLGELAFSPDAASIAFTRGGGNRDLYIMLADGTHIEKITHAAEAGQSDNSPSWRRVGR